MSLHEFMEQGGCEGCQFYGVIDVDGRKDCMFHWYDDESDDWEFSKNCDEIELKNRTYSRTNADRIRSMSDEELAELFVYWDCDGADYSTNLPINGCKWGSKEEMLYRVIDYLQSEVEE